jgi:hypothetical protein
MGRRCRDVGPEVADEDPPTLELLVVVERALSPSVKRQTVGGMLMPVLALAIVEPRQRLTSYGVRLTVTTSLTAYEREP